MQRESFAYSIERSLTDYLCDVVEGTGGLKHFFPLPRAPQRVELLLDSVHVVDREARVEDVVILVYGVPLAEDNVHHVDVCVGALQAVHVLLPVAPAHGVQHSSRDGVSGPSVRIHVQTARNINTIIIIIIRHMRLVS
jgi:hypothetical protein